MTRGGGAGGGPSPGEDGWGLEAAKVALVFLFLGECERLGVWDGKVGAEV